MQPFNNWKPYTTPLFLPNVLDMRSGGSIDLHMGVHKNHSWGAGLFEHGSVYGYGTSTSSITYPGPTILTRRNKPLTVTWHNDIYAPHILDSNIDHSLLMNVTKCYPKCGVPTIVHVHGLATSADSDGLPIYSFGQGHSRVHYYPNSQPASTLVYHDHALGLSRLNIMAGLIGIYIIEEEEDDDDDHKNTHAVDSSIRVQCDIPLLIQDKILGSDGSILYPESECTHVSSSNWVPEAYGTVQLVNGVVAPYVHVPSQQCRLRLINGSNARQYSLHIPFADKCVIIAKDAAYVKHPIAFSDEKHTDPSISSNGTLLIYPFERIELLCDFTHFKVGSVFNITNMIDDEDAANETDQDNDDGAIDVFQVRVTPSSSEPAVKVELPSILNPIKNLRSLWKTTGGLTRNITLQELANPLDTECPMQLRIYEGDHYRDFTKNEYIGCQIGTVEKWNFRNPSADFHPFHWHLVHAQCGPTEDTPNTNELRDVFAIPSKENSNQITQVCYVACTPIDFLIENTTVLADKFVFNASSPYLIHCHILEHEENMMMTWFYPMYTTKLN